MGKAWRKRVLAVALIGLAVGAVLCGCSSTSSVTGTYVNQDNPSDELELRPDGTYYMSIRGIGVYGRYEVKGGALTLIGKDGSATRVTIKGNTITFPEGSVVAFYGTTWVKDGGVKDRQSDVSSVAGDYVNRDNPQVLGQLGLRRDGSFDILIAPGVWGRYEVKGSTLTLIGKGGTVVRATIKGDTITSPEGSAIALLGRTWVKDRELATLYLGTHVTYVNPDNRRSELTLSSDGTFKITGDLVQGRFEVKGSTLTLKGQAGWAARATIKGDTITFDEGSLVSFWGRTWVKE